VYCAVLLLLLLLLLLPSPIIQAHHMRSLHLLRRRVELLEPRPKPAQKL